MLTYLFWISLFLILYTYLLFPVVLFVLTKVMGKSGATEPAGGEMPSVAILCAMYNEEKVVREKIENFLKLRYDRIRLFIGSDGSSDGTNGILREYSANPRIVFFEFSRRGKVHVINDLVSRVDEDIVVFTDANSMFEPEAVQNLVKPFANPKIGAVCGRLKLVSAGLPTGEGFYWKYETLIKKLENMMDCVIGANGAIYAVRRSLLKTLPANTINDDFTNSMRVVEQGYGIKYAEDAVASEEVHQDDTIEFRRHVRDGAGHYRAVICLYRLLNPLKFKTFFLYVSHRFIRWSVPFLMIISLVLPLFIKDDPVVRAVYFLEIGFYFLVLIGWLTRTKISVLYIPFYFVYINYALLLGFWRTVLGLQKVTWNSTQR